MAKLGDRVEDEITGFQGIVTGRSEYLYGSVQVHVAAEKLDKIPDGQWFDEDRVKVVKAGAVQRRSLADARAGGPLTCPAPPVR
jgi:hypothetical protein